MDLQITHPAVAWNGFDRENVFFATDLSGRDHGYSYVAPQVLPHQYPDRPLNIYFELEADAQSRYMLFGAAIARARQLRDANPSMQARVFTYVYPDQKALLDFYASASFRLTDAENKVRLHADGLDGRLPMGLEVCEIPLHTTPEQQAFLARLYANDMTNIDLSYLGNLLRNQHVCALAVVNQGQCVGEALFSGMGDSSELVAIYTVPAARRQGIATALIRQCMAVLSREGVTRFMARMFTASPPHAGLCRAFSAEVQEVMAYLPSFNL